MGGAARASEERPTRVVSAMSRAILLVIVLGSAGARAEEVRWDHRGALGLLLGSGIEFKNEVKAGGTKEEGRRVPLETLFTFPLGLSGNEWSIGARTGFGGSEVDVALAGGIRGYFGEERFKTYLSAEMALHIVPNVTAGPRLGVGIIYELLPTLGLYLGGAAEVTAGEGIRIAGVLTGGVQLRTYVFE
jgi:hypothetical protein